jgi:hypothetical protein
MPFWRGWSQSAGVVRARRSVAWLRNAELWGVFDTASDRLRSIESAYTNAGSLSVQLPALTGDAVSLATFRGTVRGCPGPGTATIRFVAILGVTPGHNIARMEVAQGTGSGGLTTLEGTAYIDATVHPDGTINGSGEFRLDCAEVHQPG